MPEGHTIHRLAREHQRLLGGQPVHASSPQGRFIEGAARLNGRDLDRTEAYGKHLFHRYGDVWLHVHLGLIGKFATGPAPAPDPVGALRLRLETDEHWVDLRGAIICELLDRAEVAMIRSRLGPDPLRRDANPDQAWARLSRSRVAIGALLMDQSVLAGIGNVYRAEILFRHGIDPHITGREISKETWDALWADLVALMRTGVRTGRIVTTRPEDRPRRVTPELALYVYRRDGQPCRVCGTAVRTEPMVGRNLFWCPSCQG